PAVAPTNRLGGGRHASDPHVYGCPRPACRHNCSELRLPRGLRPVRWPLLLSREAMSDGHVRRTRLDNGRRTKKAGVAVRRGRGRPLWLWLVLFILPRAGILAPGWGGAVGSPRADMESV